MQITPFVTSNLKLNFGINKNSVRKFANLSGLERDTVCFTSKPVKKSEDDKKYDEKDVCKIIGIKNYSNQNNIQLYKDILNTVDETYIDYFRKSPKDLMDFKFLIERTEYPVNTESKNTLHCIINDLYLNKPDEDEQDAIREYKNDDNSDMNKLLSNQKYKGIPHNSAYINAMTGFLNKRETPEDIKLYRGDTNLILNKLTDEKGNSIGHKIYEVRKIRRTNPKAAKEQIKEIENDLKGRKFIQERFLSTTIDKDIAEYDFNFGILWKFNLPKGSQAAFLENTQENDYLIKEKEVLVQRDSMIEIKDVKYDDEKQEFIINADIKTTKNHI